MRGENQETWGEANLFQFWNPMKEDRKISALNEFRMRVNSFFTIMIFKVIPNKSLQTPPKLVLADSCHQQGLVPGNYILKLYLTKSKERYNRVPEKQNKTQPQLHSV